MSIEKNSVTNAFTPETIQRFPVGFMISAPRKSSGKTTLTLGISAALVGSDIQVRVFKKGPDYIDPMWHRTVTGRPCYNIDPFWMSGAMCQDIFTRNRSGIDVSIVEGNHGLHDGLDKFGSNSSAALAKTLGIPVVLVVDSSGMNRGVAATVLGHQMMDPELRIAGVILNNTASQRQVSKQRDAIEHYCGIPVLGAMPRSARIHIKERHLGLVTIHESALVEDVVEEAKLAVRENCDLEQLISVSQTLPIVETTLIESSATTHAPVKIGVAMDKSFCFYYERNLEALKAAGAELINFDTLKDTRVPDVQGIYIGGGFPESFAAELERNHAMRQDLLGKIEAGMPVYAECGGLMYLTRAIYRDGNRYSMVGAIAADVEFTGKLIGKGYAELETIPAAGWFQTDYPIKGHEFHYSLLKNIDDSLDYVYNVTRGTGIKPGLDGIVYRNVIASYAHIHSDVVPDWASRFVEFARSLNVLK